MEILIILIIIAVIVGRQEEKGVFRLIPHMNKESKYQNPHQYDVLGPF